MLWGISHHSKKIIMSTYYGYVEQSAKDQINWGEIGKNISDMLNKQVEVREERRDEINKATNEITSTLNDTSILGQSQNANAWWQHNAGQLQDYMLMQHRLWKNGQLDNVSYKTNMENVKNKTNELMQIFNNYNKYNDIRVKQAQDNKISGQGKFIFDNVSQYADLNNTNLYINAVNGDMTLSRKVLDPATGQYVADKSADGLKNVGDLMSAMLTEFKTFDLDESLQNPVKSYGKMLINEIGGLAKYSNPEDVMSAISDIRISPYYKKSEDGIVNMIMGNPDAASSIYSDIVNTGLDYKQLFTYSQEEADKNPDKVLLKMGVNGRYYADFSGKNGENQKKKVDEAVRARINTMLDREVTSNFNPLLARAEYEQKTSAARAAEIKAKQEAKDRELTENTTKDYYNQRIPLSKTVIDPDTNKAVTVETTPTVSQLLNEELLKETPDVRTVVNEIMGSIKQDGKSFQGFNVQDEIMKYKDGTDHHVMKISLPDGYIKDNVAITAPIPSATDEIGRRKFEQMVANLFNLVVTNNKDVDATRIINYEKIPFEWKERRATRASNFN
jgi:hypothetical protein